MAPLLAWADASESSLSGAGHGESQDGMPRDYIAELLEEIKTFVFQRRIRIKDNFQDFDLARTNRCTKPNFARALCSVAPFLKPFQVDALAEHFTERKLEVRWPRVVNYVMFCETINDVFGPSKLEKCPTKKVFLPGERLRSAGGYFKAKSFPGDEERLGAILNKVAVLCRTRGVELSSCLRSKTGNEYPRHSGKVPSLVLLQRFPFMSQFSNEDLDILARKYTDNHGTVHLHALEMDVYEIFEANRAEEISAGVYSDQDEDEEMASTFQEDAASQPSRSSRPASSNIEDQRRHCRSASSGARRARPQTAPLRREPVVTITLDQVLAKIVTIMRKRSLRLPERFIDFDRLRKGVVAAGQMRSTLTILGLDLQRAELEVLEKAYSSIGPGDAATDPRSFFRYRDFCKDVSRLEAAKAQKNGSRRSSANSQLTRLVNIIKSKARSRRLEFYDAFKERNKGGIRGRVRRSTLLRVMHALGFPLTDPEVDTLCEGFSDEMGFNYYKFCSAVDPFMATIPEKMEKAKKIAPIQIPTTVYFDSSKQVVPHPAKLIRPSSAPQFRR